MILNNKITRGISWNSLGSISTAVIFFICSPIYLSILGINSFAYIGLWQTFLVVITLFDFGFGPSIAKEFSNPSDGIVKYEDKTTFFYSLEKVNLSIVAILLFVTTGYFFLIDTLNPKDSNYFFLIISVIIFLPMLLYQNLLLGLQQQLEMNLFIISFNISRHLFGLIILYLTNDIKIFFILQTLINLILILAIKIYSCKKMREAFPYKKAFSIKVVKSIIPFSIGMAATSFLGLTISNFDKVALAFLGSNQNISVYILAFTAASVLQLIIQPFYKTFYPIFSELQRHPKKLESAFKYASKYFSVLIFPVYLFALVFAEELIFTWIEMDDGQLIIIFRILLTCFLFTGLVWLPAAYQQAKSITNIHNSMMLISIILGAITFILFHQSMGIIAFCLIWFFHALTGYMLEIPIMYRKLFKKLPLSWYVETTIKPLILFTPCVFASIALKSVFNLNTYLLLIICVIIFAIAVFLEIRNIQNIKNET